MKLDSAGVGENVTVARVGVSWSWKGEERREGGREEEVYTISPANQVENCRCQRQYDLCSQVRHSSIRFTSKHWLQSRLGSKKSLVRTRSQ